MIKNFFKKYKSYIISVLISLGVGVLSSLLTIGNMGLFESVKKPPLSPPAFLFPIVWTALYVLMGISAAIIYEKRTLNEEAARSGLSFYLSSLIVNFAWSIIFFNFEAYFIAFIWLILLLALIILTVIDYQKVDKVAAYLQIPYIIWVSFAGYLSCGIWLLN